MASNRELEAGLRAMAVEFHLPGGGRKKLARLIADHLWWFDAAEQRGMSWGDIARALAAAGVTTQGEKAFGVGTLSSTVWRKREVTPESESEASRGDLRPNSSHTLHSARTLSGRTTRAPARESEARTVAERPRTAQPKTSPSDRLRKGGTPQKEDILAFMDRARSVRRPSK
jgi:hypothetical protein